MSKPLTLSLVIPVYNEEHHLKACLDAVAAQSEHPDEVIIVNNNSTDATLKVAEQYSFVRILQEKKQGVVFARDTGFNAAKSELIGRIDGETILPPNWVKRVKQFYAAPRHHDFALTGGGYFYNVSLPRFNGWVQSQLAYRFNRFITGFYIVWGSNMVVPNHVWRAIRRDVCQDNSYHEDLDLAIHLHEKGFPIHYQANLRVGAYLKRVWEDRSQQNEHLARWPNTLRAHHFRLWWLSISGNIMLKYLVQPFAFMTEFFIGIVKHNASK